MGKYLLTQFGGGPEIWTTCMFFFQMVLVLGYGYAYLISRLFSKKIQVFLYVTLIICLFFMFPLEPAKTLALCCSDNPRFQIFIFLFSLIGIPFLVLSSTGPVVQNWFVWTNPEASPYRLYSLSNTASLLALISYPLFFEPIFSRDLECLFWSWGLVFFSILCCGCAIWVLKSFSISSPLENKKNVMAEKPSIGASLLWFGLSASASLELLAITNKICQSLPIVPFLWVLPLSLYLISFIICFHHSRWYIRPLFLGVFVLSVSWVIFTQYSDKDTFTGIQRICIYSALLFILCMICHGELFRLRPHPKYLTWYYFIISFGGAFGGFFAAGIAPLIFKTYQELHIGLLFICVLVLLSNEDKSRGYNTKKWVWSAGVLICGFVAIFYARELITDRTVAITRNFFGVISIWERDQDDPDFHRFSMESGMIIHGLQFKDPQKSLQPTGYYGQNSGFGLTMKYFPRQEKRRIGAVGLGIGTILSYSKSNDYFRFYEINPEVKKLAETEFSYLADAKGQMQIILGDARVSLEKEVNQDFDILVLDAFNGAAVPVHLLTKESFDIYLRHLKPDGVIASHISSRNVDLLRVMARIAAHMKLRCLFIENRRRKTEGVFSSKWALLTNNEKFIKRIEKCNGAINYPVDSAQIDLWSDDHVNMLEVIRF